MVFKVVLLILSMAAATPSPEVRHLRGDKQVGGSNSTLNASNAKNASLIRIPSESSSAADHSLSPENLTAYLLGGWRFVAQALGVEAAFNETTKSSQTKTSKTRSRYCLCIFDIDRTITGRQEDTGTCPGNKVVGGHDDAYGGGKVTLSHLGQNVWNTWCSADCHVRGISAHHRARPNIPVPQNILSCNRGCKARKARRMAQELGVRRSQVYMFDDKASNIRPFQGTGMNAHQISCNSREGNIGLCGATTSELKRQKGVTTCR